MSDWISVNDRLPERNGWYLTYGPTRVMDVLHYCGDEWGEPAWASEYIYDAEVTHWMPMPEGPDEDEKGESR